MNEPTLFLLNTQFSAVKIESLLGQMVYITLPLPPAVLLVKVEPIIVTLLVLEITPPLLPALLLVKVELKIVILRVL